MHRFLRSLSKKAVIVALAVLAVVLLAAILLLRCTHFLLCGRCVQAEEWNFYQDMFRAQVSAEYYQQYGLELDTDSAWNVSCDGKKPRTSLQETAAAAIVQDDTLRRLAAEYDVEPMPSFVQMSEELQDVNSQRTEDKSNGLVVYGTVEYTMETYYLEQKSACETAVVEAMMQQILQSPAELQQAYQQMQPEDFPQALQAELVMYQIDAEEFYRDQDAADKAMRALEAELSQARVPDAQQAQEIAEMPVTVSEKWIDSQSMSREDDTSAHLLAESKKHGQGGYFLEDEGTLVYVKAVKGTEKPPLENNEMIAAAWLANHRLDEALGMGQ